MKRLALLLAGAAAAAEAEAKKHAGLRPTCRIAEWTGDDFTLGHKFRAGDFPDFPPADVHRNVDFVIVGGGLAGLAAAYNLRDHDFLLLEQYDDFGGHARGGTYKGIDYSWAGAYVGTTNGYYGELYSELGLEAVKLGPERNAWRWGNTWYEGVEPRKKNVRLYGEFKKLLAEIKPIRESLPEDPEPESLTANIEKLDAKVFSTCLSGYSEEFVKLLDSYSRSAFCGGLDQISALAGYGLLADLTGSCYVFKGGNPAIAKAFLKKLNAAGSGRMTASAFVWKVEMSASGASVIYSKKDGSVERVNCKHVILAAPPLVAARQLSKINNALKAGLLNFKFGSYLVANLLLSKRIFPGGYDNYVGAPTTFADITVAEYPYLKTNSYDPATMGSVLTVYQPYPALSPGRQLMLVSSREDMAAPIIEQMRKLVDGLDNALEEVVLSRWGHAMAIVGPGYYSSLAKLRKIDTGSLSLAHSSLEGWPAVESALRGGRRAAQKALSVKS